MTAARPRRPRTFEPGDSRVVVEPYAAPGAASPAGGPAHPGLPSRSNRRPGIRWGAILLSAVTGLFALASGVWLAHFTSQAVARDDWIGWTATGLVVVAGAAAGAIILREAAGLLRLRRLGRLRQEADSLLARPDPARERDLALAVAQLFHDRPETAWALARFREHLRDVRDGGDMIRLAERELLAPLDREARRHILVSAKRVATVTAISPLPLVAMLFVLFENLRLLRTLATLYGGRPGKTGGLKLARMVVNHILATGGLALTDDLLGQFLGQDLVRRLSRRLGEGAFNGALTARIGAAAIDVCRPMPFVDAAPVRARDILAELFRRSAEPPGPERPPP